MSSPPGLGSISFFLFLLQRIILALCYSLFSTPSSPAGVARATRHAVDRLAVQHAQRVQRIQQPHGPPHVRLAAANQPAAAGRPSLTPNTCALLGASPATVTAPTPASGGTTDFVPSYLPCHLHSIAAAPHQKLRPSGRLTTRPAVSPKPSQVATAQQFHLLNHRTLCSLRSSTWRWDRTMPRSALATTRRTGTPRTSALPASASIAM